MSDSVKPWDILNPNIPRVPDHIEENRFNTCKSCEYFLSLTQRCEKCGCFMAIKTKLAQAECPVGKWGKHE